MQSLQKQLKIRIAALPVLKSKEAYLRITIKKERSALEQRIADLDALHRSIGDSQRLFAEFPKESIRVEAVMYGSDNVAGISIPTVGRIDFDEDKQLILDPSWLPWGRSTLKSLLRAQAEIDVAEKRIGLLEYARRKTTQKVNLYEKVQIPDFSEAILKIKRFLEDVENLDKASQKITKARQNAAMELLDG